MDAPRHHYLRMSERGLAMAVNPADQELTAAGKYVWLADRDLYVARNSFRVTRRRVLPK